MALTKIDDRGLKLPLDLLDNEKIRLGTGNDLQIYHDSSDSIISDLGTGSLLIRTNGSAVEINKAASEYMARFICDGAVQLYHNNNKKFETIIDGINVLNTGGSGNTKLRVTGNEASNAELHLVADEGDDNTDNWKISSNANDNNLNFENWNGAAWEKGLSLTPNSSTILYHNNVEKFKTTTQGTRVTGGLLVDTVDDLINESGTYTYTYGYYSAANTQNGLTVRGNEAALEICASDQSHHAGSFVIRGGNEGFGFINSSSNDRLELVSFTASNNGFALHNAGGNLSRRDVCMMIQKDGAIELYHDNSEKFETTSGGARILGNLQLDADNRKAIFGSSNDLEIFHNGTDSIIRNTGHPFRVRSNDFKIENEATEDFIECNNNAEVILYYDNVAKFKTTSLGAEVTGGGGSTIFDVIHQNGTQGIGIDYNTIRTLGTNTDQPIKLMPRGTHTSESAVRLYFNDSEKFRTTSDGVRVVGILNLDSHIAMGDNDTIHLGSGNDFRIYHDGTTNYIRTENGSINIIKSNTENIAKFIPDAGVELYNNNVKKFATGSNGVYHDNSGTLADNAIHFERGTGTGDYSTIFGVTNNPDCSGYGDQDDGYWNLIKSKGGTHIVLNSDGAYNSGRNNHDHFSIYQKANTEVSNAGRRLFSVDNIGQVQFGKAGIVINNAWGNQPSITVQRDNNHGEDNTDNSAYMRVHGIGDTHKYWTGAESAGADFSVNFIIDGSTYATSDGRAKTDIVDCPYGLDVVNKLQPRKYQLVNSQLTPQGDDNINLGFVAQEIKEHIPECVNYLGDEANTPNEKGWARAYALDIGEVIPVLTKAIQELSDKVKTLETKVAALEAT